MDFLDRSTEDPARVRLKCPGLLRVETDSASATCNGASLPEVVFLEGLQTLHFSGPLTRCSLWALEDLSEVEEASLDGLILSLGVDTAAGTERGKRNAIARHLERAP